MSETLISCAILFYCLFDPHCDPALAQSRSTSEQFEEQHSSAETTRRDGATLTLEQALKLSLSQNASIRNAETQLKRQDQVIVEARSFLLPKVDLLGNVEIIDKGLLPAFDGKVFGSNKSWDSRAELTQPIYTGGRAYAYYEQQTLTRTAAAYQLEATIAEVFLQVRERFYQVLLSRAQVEVQERSVVLLEKQLEYAKGRFETGIVSQFEVLRAEVAVANGKTPLIRAKNSVAVSFEELIRVLGVNETAVEIPTSANDLDGELRYNKGNFTLEELLATAAANRPELKRLTHLVQAADAGVDVEWGKYLPEISAKASYGVEKSRFTDSFGDSLDGWRVGAHADWRIFDSGETTARVEQAKADVQTARTELRQKRLDVDVEVRRTFSSLHEAQALVEASSKVVEQAEESLRLAENRYTEGVGTQLDVLDAQVARTEASTNNVQARHDYVVVIARLLQAVGKGGATSPAEPGETR